MTVIINFILFILIAAFNIDISWLIILPIGFLVLTFCSGLPFYIYNLEDYRNKLKKVIDGFEEKNKYFLKLGYDYPRLHRISLVLDITLSMLTIITYLNFVNLL